MAVADALHMSFECPVLQAVRQRYAPLFFHEHQHHDIFLCTARSYASFQVRSRLSS